jgi:DNA polymerase-3 subunit beta
LTVNAKTFGDILRTIDEEHVTIVIEESKDQLTVQTASDEFKIKGIPASEYVAVPEVQSDQPVTLTAEKFSTGIGKVEYAVTEKNFSPVLTGVLMRTKDYDGKKKLVFVGTDSFRLAEYKIDSTG